jgi:hypothetical protein
MNWWKSSGGRLAGKSGGKLPLAPAVFSPVFRINSDLSGLSAGKSGKKVYITSFVRDYFA